MADTIIRELNFDRSYPDAELQKIAKNCVGERVVDARTNRVIGMVRRAWVEGRKVVQELSPAPDQIGRALGELRQPLSSKGAVVAPMTSRGNDSISSGEGGKVAADAPQGDAH